MSAIRTRSGPLFDLAAPRADLVRIEDIAHALSHICRYTGHVSRFYSVAQHSCFVSDMLPPKFKLWGLLHDAAEAYIGDVSSPLKTLLPDYRKVEARMEEVVWGKFGLVGPLPAEVKEADNKAYEYERQALMPGGHGRFQTWTSEGARAIFLDTFRELTTPIYEMAASG